jgi:uncharacterized protein (DUF433 family)
MKVDDAITSDPEILGGMPVIKGRVCRSMI